jgi:beta-mannosidase
MFEQPDLKRSSGRHCFRHLAGRSYGDSVVNGRFIHMSGNASLTSSTQLSWTVGWAKTGSETPETFVPASVPGAVQLDWARAQGWEPYWVADHWKEYGWMEDVFWTYHCVLALSEKKADQRLFLVLQGIDYRFRILLNGKLLLEQEGMFTPVELDLTETAKSGDLLAVTVFPAPKSKLQPADRSQSDQSCKPAVSYGWDFHPRLIPLGIWDEAYLEWREPLALHSPETRYTLADDFSQADLSLRVEVSSTAGGEVCWQILDESGKTVLEKRKTLEGTSATLEGTLEQPELWWCHDQGRPVLYRNRVELRDSRGHLVDVREERLGFRRIRLVMHEGAWDWPELFPKSRSMPPVTIEINGRVIFAKGANWVSPEIFPGLLNREGCEAQLKLARDAHMNLLRMWGGAVVQKDSFFEVCDELGILVWQEFPLACNNYRDTKEYLKVLDQESRSMIKRLRHHPSLAMWCGGNELFNAWSGMTDQSLALRLLNRNCFDLDPDKPFLMTSPVDGVGHGHYVFRDPESGQEAWNVFQSAASTAYCEFGCPGPASREVLESIIPVSDLFPPREGTSWECHHAFGVWMKSSHLYPEVTEHYFGPTESLDQLIERGQLLQAEGYKGLFEEARRQKPRASMALCWCLNEPWPSAANNSLISWPCRPKPALAAVGQACRPVLASARIRQFQWQEGDCFDPELWILSDSPRVWEGDDIQVRIECGTETFPLMTWPVTALGPNINFRGPKVQFVIPDFPAERFELVLHSERYPEISSRYVLKYSRQKRKKKNPRSMN